MSEQSLLTVLVVAGAWVVLELLKYAYAQLLAVATRRRENNTRAKVSQAAPANPGNSGMSAGELRSNFHDVKELLGKVLDAAEGARGYAKRTFDEVKR